MGRTPLWAILGGSEGACGDCFRGLTAGKPAQRTKPGTWEPSAQSLASPPANPWATPAPVSTSNRGGSKSFGDFEFELTDLDSDAQRSSPPSRSQVEKGLQSKRSKFEVEQLLCSPGGLSSPKVPARATATQKMLSTVPKALLEARTPQGQEARRGLLKGATLVFVSAGYQGKRFIYERAAELGVKTVIIDSPDSWSRGLVDEGLIAKFMPVDMSQTSEGVFNDCCAMISSLGEDGLTGPAEGITTFVELSVPLAARLAEAFGLPGMSSEAVDSARDKHATRAALKAAGLPTPRNMLIKKESDLQAAGQYVQFPAVLKPISGAASLGVKKVTCMQDLVKCYREVVQELGSLVVSSGALVKADGSGSGVNASDVIDLTLLMEQYLDGTEVDVDIVMSDGKWQYAAVADNGPTKEPYFNETWGVCPSLLDKEKQSALKDMGVKCVESLGFTSGVFHVELKYTSTGPQLIEVNARMGGGPIRECNRRVWGVDLVEEAIYCATGIPSRPALPPKPLTCIGYSMVNAPSSGTVRSVEYFEDLKEKDGVVSSAPCVEIGDTVVGPKEGLPTWVCVLVVTRSTPKAALDYVLALEDGMPMSMVA